MKLFNRCNQLGNQCISSTKILGVLAFILLGSMLFASVYNSSEPMVDIVPLPEKDSVEVWIPTKEDIEYQDSMYAIIERTSADVDTIKDAIDHILYKLERIEYADGTYDSIRYQEGGRIDKSRNQ